MTTFKGGGGELSPRLLRKRAFQGEETGDYLGHSGRVDMPTRPSLVTRAPRAIFSLADLAIHITVSRRGVEMAIDQVQRCKRRCGPKVKTGCGTCRVRRIKCDEAKPSCQRCLTTGRKCDGYSSDIAICSQTLQNSTDLIQRISVHIPGNAEEKRGFDFFLRNTAAELSGYYDSSFWEKLILAASVQKPSLRHAVIALGALHEDFSQKRPVPPTPSAEDQKTQFALNQYAKAMGALRRSLSKEKEEPLTALMSCILFVCFDSLRGWFESAMVHLQSGLRILRDMRRSSTRNHIIEDNIAPLFTRLSLQSIIYVDTKSTHDQAAFATKLMDVSRKEFVIPEEFESLGEARNALDQAADGLFRAFYIMDADLPVVLQPIESLAIYDRYTSQLSLWNLAFERFMVSKSKDLSSKDIQGAGLMKIHHTTAKIMAGVRPDMSDMRAMSEAVTTERFLEYLDDFKIVINLSRPLIAAAEQDAKNGKPPFTFSSNLGLIGPLYYLCINCPIVSMRTTAMELLLRCPRREGMWNSGLIAQMIQQYWELEAKHKEAQEMGVEVDEFGFPVPFRDQGSVHFAFYFSFFDPPTELNSTGLSPPPEVAPPDPVRSPPSLGLQSNPATHRDTSRQELEAEALAVLAGAISHEQEWQPLADNVRGRARMSTLFSC
ncbi:putative transcriptional regulatory protein [Lachnellula cervina]|uniref:Putative transcriptional regulatory protein n=1 Tax=Lachnellula cervina TaxID=1316786 RepID=A0A7D8YV23_9HELO|nr:putative transcriptional regulatory protein [Lachnellula cervina]